MLDNTIILFDTDQNDLLDMQLQKMYCKHVLKLGEREKHILEISNELGYSWCLWGTNEGHGGDLNHHLGIIHGMERDNYNHAIRIVVCRYAFSNEKFVWVDNLHSCIRYIRKFGLTVTLKEVPFYVVDISENPNKIISYKGSLRNKETDIFNALQRALDRRAWSNSQELLNNRYSIQEFIHANPELLVL